ncbi:MAG: NAD-dependent epimerase/dehydratase family protein [Parachlamydiaceae bacterium]
MSKNVFITGIAGFIGYHLANYLAKRGDRVTGIDNFNTYYFPQLKHDRANELQKLGVEVLPCDINANADLERAILAHNTTHLVHLAAQAGVRYSLTSPESYLKANVDGFLSLLEICRRHPSIPFIYASSSSVYGTNTKVPFSIEDRTDQQASLYGVTKKANELMANTYHHLFGIPVTGLRFFTVYGPWGRPDMAYYSFTKAILSGQPIDVYGEGKMLRDFTYIDDIIAGTAAAIDLESPCEIFNLGNHQPVSLMTMIEILEKYCKKQANKRFLPMPAGDVPTTYADISYSQQKLRFQPETSLDQGLEKFMNWYLRYH